MKDKILCLIRRFFKRDGVFFVGATDILPPPLSKEDEDRFLELKENGDTYAKVSLLNII